MKKFIIIFFILVAAGAHADSWFDPILTMKVGLFKGNDMLVTYDGNVIAAEQFPDWTVGLDLKAGGILFNWIWIEGQMVTWTEPPVPGGPTNYFAPYQSDYWFRVGLQQWGIRLGWEHSCYHPTLTWGDNYAQRYGGKDQLFIEFDLERLRAGA